MAPVFRRGSPLSCARQRANSMHFVPENGSTFHHELHVLQLLDVFQWIAADCHKVGPLAGFGGSQLVAPAEQFRSGGSARSNRVHGRHAVLSGVFKLLSLLHPFPPPAPRPPPTPPLHPL